MTAETSNARGDVVAWRVPVLQSPFGEWLDHGVRDGLVLVMHRGTHGWKAAGQGYALLAHQIYVKNVEPLCATSHEVAVVGLSGGGWRTVWARSDDDVTHPAPPSAPVGVEWTDERIIAVCKAAGVRWIEADEEEGGFPGGFDITHMPEMRRLFTALAQQPAAVDEAMVERACKAALDEVWPDTYEEADDLRAMIRRILSAALAAQHQEPTT